MLSRKYTTYLIPVFAMTRYNAFARASFIAIASAAFIAPGQRSPARPAANDSKALNSAPSTLLDTLVRLERGALDRWIRLDPDGYLALYADDATYFDPMTDQRVDGLAALRARIEPIRQM